MLPKHRVSNNTDMMFAIASMPLFLGALLLQIYLLIIALTLETMRSSVGILVGVMLYSGSAI